MMIFADEIIAYVKESLLGCPKLLHTPHTERDLRDVLSSRLYYLTKNSQWRHEPHLPGDLVRINPRLLT